MARYPIGQWRQQFRGRTTAIERRSVSMVYRLYCSSRGEAVHYVGRSDLGLEGRISAHVRENGNIAGCNHNCTHVEFWIIRNSDGKLNRKLRSFRAESMAYHRYNPRCNSDHPNRRGVSEIHECPSPGCDH